MARWTEQWLICGVPGSGKSYMAHRLVERSANVRRESLVGFESFDTDARVWVYDPTRQWRDERTIKGLPILEWEEREEYPFVGFGDDEIEEVCETAGGDGELRAVVVFDECLTIESAMYPAIKKMCALRRHRDIELFFCTQRPRTIPVPVLALCSQVVCFQLHHPDDIKHLRGVLQPADLDRLPSLALPTKKTAPEYLHRDMTGKGKKDESTRPDQDRPRRGGGL